MGNHSWGGFRPKRGRERSSAFSTLKSGVATKSSSALRAEKNGTPCRFSRHGVPFYTVSTVLHCGYPKI